MSRRRGAGEAISDTARLEAFSDGVMAIAITLLVLDIHIPLGQSDLGAALVRQWPSYAAFAVSFITIGIMWVNHHRMLKLIERTDHWFLMINVFFLMTVSFVPFPTALVAAYLRNPHQRGTAAVTYGLSMVAVAIAFNLVWEYACAKGGHLLVERLDRGELRKRSRGYRMGPVVYLVVTLVALANALIGLALFAAVDAYWMFPGSGPA